MRWLLPMLVLAGCQETRAQVQCQSDPAAGGVRCSVQHVSGDAKVRVCWDFVVDCVNGTRAKSSACQDVEPNQTTTYLMREADFKGLDTCDSLRSSAVTNLVITKR